MCSTRDVNEHLVILDTNEIVVECSDLPHRYLGVKVASDQERGGLNEPRCRGFQPHLVFCTGARHNASGGVPTLRPTGSSNSMHIW